MREHWVDIVGAAPPPARSLLRIKLEDFVQNPALVQSLKDGVEVMKKRESSDPKSWFFQAAVHGVTPEAVSEALKSDPKIAKIDQDKFWNQCPHFDRPGITTADFLVWHRICLLL